MGDVDILVPNKHQAISNHHAVNTDSSQDFIWNVSVEITEFICQLWLRNRW